MRITLRALTCLLLLQVASAALAEGPFYLKTGDRVVFYGDSITDQRLYTTYTETYVVTRFPHRNITFIHSGWGGDRVTGGGGGPIDLRLQRDVVPYRPTVVTIMLGMNDAGYRPFDENLYNTYTTGYRHIIDTLKQDLPHVRTTVIQPSPFDDVTRAPSFPGGYNAVLIRYGDFVKNLAAEDALTLADMNTPVVATLEKANSLEPALASKLIPDRVHPGPAGHIVMAEALLKAWNAPATVTDVEIDAAAKRVARTVNAHVQNLAASEIITWDEDDDALPFPLDLNDPAVSLVVKASDVVRALDEQPLRVTGLTAPRYDLKIDGEDVGTFTREQLAEGLNLAVLPTPMVRQAEEVHALTVRHNNIHFTRWRTLQVPFQNDHYPHVAQAMSGLDSLEADLVSAQRAAAQPKTRHYELSPAT